MSLLYDFAKKGVPIHVGFSFPLYLQPLSPAALYINGYLTCHIFMTE